MDGCSHCCGGERESLAVSRVRVAPKKANLTLDQKEREKRTFFPDLYADFRSGDDVAVGVVGIFFAIRLAFNREKYTDLETSWDCGNIHLKVANDLMSKMTNNMQAGWFFCFLRRQQHLPNFLSS